MPGTAMQTRDVNECCLHVQMKLGYTGKQGHRAFRRLKRSLETEECVADVFGYVDGQCKDKPIVCVK